DQVELAAGAPQCLDGFTNGVAHLIPEAEDLEVTPRASRQLLVPHHVMHFPSAVLFHRPREPRRRIAETAPELEDPPRPDAAGHEVAELAAGRPDDREPGRPRLPLHASELWVSLRDQRVQIVRYLRRDDFLGHSRQASAPAAAAFAPSRSRWHHKGGTSFPGETVRRFLLLAALVLAVSPLEAQKRIKRDPYKISTEELAEFGDAAMVEVIPRLRPNFLMFNAGTSAGMGEQTMLGLAHTIVVYVGEQQQGDSSVLRFYKASDVKEVRYFKPGNSASPQTSGNSFVIQLLMKDKTKPED